MNALVPSSTKNCNEPTGKAVAKLSIVFKGLLLTFLSGVILSLNGVIVKYVKNIPVSQLAAYRFTAMCVFSLPQAVKTEENLLGPGELRVILILRGISAGAGTFLCFMAFRYLPIGPVSVIMSSAPVVVAIAAKIFLKERCGIVQSITVITTVVGVAFITLIPTTHSGKSTDFTWEHIYGFLAAFGGLICGSSQFIFLRKMKSVHHSVIMFNCGWMAGLETFMLTCLIGGFGNHQCGLQIVSLIAIGAVGYVDITLITMALKLENAGPVSTMRAATSVSLPFLWQVIIFHDIPDGFSITGAVIVGLSIILLGLSKWASALPSNSAAAKRFKFFAV